MDLDSKISVSVTSSPSLRKPVPLLVFAATLKGTKDEIWLGILRGYHNHEKHTKEEWIAVIDSYRSKPAF